MGSKSLASLETPWWPGREAGSTEGSEPWSLCPSSQGRAEPKGGCKWPKWPSA